MLWKWSGITVVLPGNEIVFGVLVSYLVVVVGVRLLLVVVSALIDIAIHSALRPKWSRIFQVKCHSREAR